MPGFRFALVGRPAAIKGDVVEGPWSAAQHDNEEGFNLSAELIGLAETLKAEFGSMSVLVDDVVAAAKNADASANSKAALLSQRCEEMQVTINTIHDLTLT